MYILFVIWMGIVSDHSQKIHSQEFNSEQKCESAKGTIRQIVGSEYKLICLPK